MEHVVSGHRFTVDGNKYNFVDAKIVGEGRFGIVTSAVEKLQHKRKIAIKKTQPFADSELLARHTLRELRLIKVLGAHPNMVSLCDLSVNEAKWELYMMMKLMDSDLHKLLQDKQPLTETDCKSYTKQILEGVKAMHEIGIIHRDLKPANLLVSKDCRLRIADFGNARFVYGDTSIDEDNKGGTLRYRSPEYLLAFQKNNKALDLWSIGCIVAELFRTVPLFPGDDDRNQVKRIFQVLGYVANQQLGFEVSAETRSFLEEHCRSCRKSLKTVVPNSTPGAIILITALLSVDPSKRPSAAQALSFDFLSNAREVCYYGKQYLSRPPKDLFDFEQKQQSLDELKRFIIDEVKIFEIVQNLAQNQVLKSAGERLLMLASDGSPHFAWNNIFEYLTLNDVVSASTVFSQSSFVPTKAHLEETLRRALRLPLIAQRLSRRETIIPFHPNVTMPTLFFGRTNSPTDDIVPEIALTSDTLRSIYMLVKDHVARDCLPTPFVSSLPTEVLAPVAAVQGAASSIVLNGDKCTFRRHTTAADRGRQSVQVAFPACSCHTNECNRIVLWDCSVCKNPCTDCTSLPSPLSLSPPFSSFLSPLPPPLNLFGLIPNPTLT